MSNYLRDMAAAYIEAAYFTDGDGEELGDAEFTTEFEKKHLQLSTKKETSVGSMVKSPRL
jgi:hypothetical protein